MSSKYSPAQKEQALEMLRVGGDIGLVHFATGIPRRTLRDWRKQLEVVSNRQTAEKTFFSAAANWQTEPESPQPYPEDDSPDLKDFIYIRENLIQYARYLSANLRPDEPDSNRRTLSLSRILDRIEKLDRILPDRSPDQDVRLEHANNDELQAMSPWDDADEDTDRSLPDAEASETSGQVSLADLLPGAENDDAPADADATDKDD